MQRHQIFRLQYRERRYMRHLSGQELEQRFKDVFLNQLVLTEENKIGLHPVNQEGKYWIEVFTHLCEEFKIRHGPFPAGFKNGFLKDLKIPDPRLDIANKVCETVKKLKIEPNKYLFKYGKKIWLEQALEEGMFRISPAAFYSDPSLNPAIQDDELKFSIHPDPSKLNLEVFDGKTGVPKGCLDVQKAKITEKSSTNYYVYCLSSVFVPRLFLDFDADACLIIKKPGDFVNRLIAAFEKNNPDWLGYIKNVKYHDPLNTDPHQVNVFSSKHFRYSYQKEVRLIWLPTQKKRELDHRFVELENTANIETVA